MELSELKFAVNTAELKEAVDLLGKVQQGTADLGREEGKRAPRRKKLTDEEIKANDAAKEAAKAAKKAATEQKKLGEEGEVTSGKLSKLQDQLRFLRGELIQGETGFTKMQAGAMAAAKASGVTDDVLREFATTFDNFNRITGQNPFDKSVGGLKSLDSELDRLRKTTELANQGYKLTQNQIKSLAQDIEALTQVNRSLGKSEEDITRITTEHTRQFAARATQLNDQIERSKELERQTKNEAVARVKEQEAFVNKMRAESTMMNGAVKLYQDAEADKAKALAARMRMEATAGDNAVQLFYKNEQQKQKAFEARMKAEATMMDSAVVKYYTMQSKSGNKAEVQPIREREQAIKRVAAEEAKMTSVLNTLTQEQNRGVEVSEKAARSISNYERDLRKAGITAEATAAKLETYRKQQAAVQKIEEDRQGKFLTRALQPQIGDVVVSIAAGQNPLTVMLQQMDQVRGLIAQTGVQGEALRTVMRNAFTDTIKSVKDTAVAMGSVLGGAFMALGNNVLGLVTGPFSAFKASMDAGATASGSFKDAVAALNVAFIKLVGNPVVAALVAIAVGLTTLGIAAFQVSKQEDALSKSLALTGGSMGLNKESAVAYANSLNDVGVSTSKAIDVMQAMAKEGGFLSKEISLVATTAVKMQKDAGVAIEETVKHFAKLKDKPVDALIELAKASGLISTTSIEAVIALEKQGDKAAAVALAMKISADTQIAQSNRIKTELSSLGEVMNWFSKSWTGMWDAIKGTQYNTPIKEQLQGDLIKTQQEITRVQDNLKLLEKFGIKGDPKLLNQLNATADAFSKQLQDIDTKAAAEKKLTEEQSKGAEVLKDKMRFEKEYKEKQEALDKATYTRQQAINAAIAQEAKLRKAAGGVLSASEVATISATAGQEWDKSKSSENKKVENKAQRELNESIERYNDILNKSSGYNKEFNDAILSLMIARDAGKRSQEQYNEAVNHLVKQQPFYIQQEKEAAEAAKKRADNQEWLNSVMGRSEGLTKDYTQGTERLLQMLGSGDIDATQFREALDALNKLTPAYKAYESVLANYGKTVADLEAQRKATADEYGMDFKTDEEKAALQSLSKFKKSIADSDAGYEKALADAKKFEGSREYQSMIDAAQDVADRRKMIAKDVYDREKYLQSQTYQMYAAGFDALKNLSKSFGEAVGEQFVNFAKTGKSSFEDLTSSFGNMVESMIYDLIKLQIQKQVSGLLDMGISAAVGYFTGGSTTGSSQYALTSGGSGLASMGGGTGLTFKPQANGGAWNNGVQMYAKGGVFDGPTMFGHSGGLGVLGEAGAEAVMPLKRDANGSLGVAVTGGSSSGSNVEVVINNYGSEKATTTETTDSRGNRKINISIGEMVSGEISRSGSAVQKSMQSTYGQRPQLIRR